MRKQPTSLDVARLAGVSQTTVSFVLNNRTDKIISADTRERVLKAAADLRYRSNKLSNGILRGSTKLIGVVIPSASDYYFGEVLTGISGQAFSSGYQVLMTVSAGHMGSGGASEQEGVTRLIEYRVDGIICVAWDWESEARREWLNEVLSKHIPLVIVDDSSNWRRTDCIVTDDVRGAKMAVQHLIECGYKRIAHFTGNQHLSTGRDRRIGYETALKEAGMPLDPDLIFECEYSTDRAVEQTKRMLSMRNRPDAVFSATDLMAGPVLAGLVEKGLRCPGDLGIVGYSDTLAASAMNITSIAQHPADIGRRAAEQILKRLADRSAASELITMPVSLVPRTSTARSRS